MNVTYLTEHFSYEEVVLSQLAARLGIDNTPPGRLMGNILQTCNRLESARLLLGGHPLIVSSFYRCEALERVLTASAFAAWCRARVLQEDDNTWRTYFATKSHPKGLAADITCPRFGTPYEIAVQLASHREILHFDQLIYEFGSWVHLGISADKPRLETLTINSEGVTEGIVA